MECLPRWCLLSDSNFYIVLDFATLSVSLSSYLSTDAVSDAVKAVLQSMKSHYSINKGAMEVWLPRNSARQRSALRNLALNGQLMAAYAAFTTPGSATYAGGPSSGPTSAGFVSTHQVNEFAVWRNQFVVKHSYVQISSMCRYRLSWFLLDQSLIC
jgi:hypothetical protein